MRHKFEMTDDYSSKDIPEWLDTSCENESSCDILIFRFDTFLMSYLDSGYYELTFLVKDDGDASTYITVTWEILVSGE
jgi:hypothetical protein